MASGYRIEVTAEDIEKAMAGDSFTCAIAQAIARKLPDARKIEIDIQTIRWSDKNGRHVFLTPLSAAGYVVAFDAGEDILPFRFLLKDAVPSAQKRAVSEAARATKQTRDKVNHERQREKTAAAIIADPQSPPEKIAAAEQRLKDAPERIATAEANHEDLKAAYKAAGESMAEELVSQTKRPAPPKVIKTKKRLYGMRVLRVNQAEDRVHYAGRNPV